VHQEGIADVLASRLFKFIHAIEGHHRMLDEVLIEVQGAIEIVIGRGRISG
jgi:hypothetical protein